MGGTAGIVITPSPSATTMEVSVDQYSIALRLTPSSGRLRVLGVATADDKLVQIADDRHYPPAAPQVALLLCAVVEELARPVVAAEIEERLHERLSVLW